LKLASYATFDRPDTARVGFVISDSELVDAETACRQFAPDFQGPLDMHRLIEAGPDFWEQLRQVHAALDQAGLPRLPMDTVRFLPAVPRPSKLCCLALNNSANTDRIVKGPKHPAVFTKPWSALVGHGEPIRLKPH